MDSFLIILVVGVFLALIVVFAYYAYQQQKQRRADLAALAAELGWQFEPDHDSSHDDEYSQFEVFRRGHSRSAFNTLRGTIEIDSRPCATKMGDFRYQVTTGSGKTQSTHTFQLSYLIIHLPYAGVPNMYIRQEGMFDALAGAFGFDDIDFESAQFSESFHVKSADKRFAYDVIHPGMIEFLMASDPPTVDIEEGQCCLIEGRRKWSPAEFRAKVNWARQFFALWPKHLVTALNS